MTSRIIKIEIEIPEVPVSLTSKRVKKKVAVKKKAATKKKIVKKATKKKVTKKAAKKKPRK